MQMNQFYQLYLFYFIFLNYGYLPDDFMKSAIAPIVKNKTGDTSDISNYRPIALVTAMSKPLYQVLPRFLPLAMAQDKVMYYRHDYSHFMLMICLFNHQNQKRTVSLIFSVSIILYMLMIFVYGVKIT